MTVSIITIQLGHLSTRLFMLRVDCMYIVSLLKQHPLVAQHGNYIIFSDFAFSVQKDIIIGMLLFKHEHSLKWKCKLSKLFLKSMWYVFILKLFSLPFKQISCLLVLSRERFTEGRKNTVSHKQRHKMSFDYSQK